ncbi:hypothetical protein [Microvirga zambiensis]|uniref:hypothetical protein n=1 Tax=Microvirga zambiensis TaxID=1402137 RepID=UPI00191EEF52|nr:hypothetical protein [Microvirga zambiensis]
MSTGACLYCKKTFERRHPSQRFCGKTNAGRHLCKDRYHNRAQFIAANAEREAEAEKWDLWHGDTTHPFSEDAFRRG